MADSSYLDFGLAKLIVPPSTPEGDENASTRTAAELQSPLTKEGQIVGTVAYMSPEQITGTTVDTKTDIFSFGIVLYEMLTGRRPFGGSTTFETAAEILKNEARSRLASSRTGVPLALERIIGHCLRKEPDQRFQSIADVGRLLDDIRSDLKTGQTVDASAPSSWARSNGSQSSPGRSSCPYPVVCRRCRGVDDAVRSRRAIGAAYASDV